MSAETSPPGEADRSNDSDSNNSCECPRCPKSYTATTDLTRHMRSCCPSELEPCPTCDKRYQSELGVKNHHSRAHGKQISKNTKKCDNCGSVITVFDHELDRQEHHFCDSECSAAFQKDRIKKECEICGSEMSVIPSREDIATCCSSECRIEKTRRITGSDRYNYKTREYECRQCGEPQERSPSMVYSEDRVFCDDECFDEFRRNGYDQYYGRNWNQQRRRALRRDQYRCQSCGVTPADLYREPDVHHKHPIETFKDAYPEPEWWERANKLDNLITFCPGCHREVEKMAPLCPQFL